MGRLGLRVRFGATDPVAAYRNLSLRARFTFHIAISIAALFAALIPGVVYLQKHVVLEEAQQRGLQLTKVFAHASVQAVVADDFLIMRQIVSSIASEPDVLYAMIVDPSGRLLVHNDPRETGRTYTDPMTERAAHAGRPLVQELWRRDLYGYDVAVPVYVLNDRRAVARVGISLERELAGIRRTRNLILGLAVLALGAGFALAAWQARTVTRPVAELVRAASAVAAGSLDHRIPVRGGDEVGQLGEAFNRLGESLKVRREFDRAISSTLDLGAVLQTIADHARALLGTDLAYVASYDAAAGAATVLACAGDRTGLLRGLAIVRGRGAGGHVLETGEPLVVPDYARDARVTHEDELVRREGVVSALLIPIARKDRTVGLLCVADRHPTAFTTQDREVVLGLAGQAAIAIENATLYEQVRQYADELEGKVDARTRELQEANQHLEAASRHKSEFLANMSHELRTPLNAIIGFSEVLLERMFGEMSPKQTEYLQDILASGRHLLSLINDILDLSKVEAGRMELELAPFSLPETLENALMLVRERAGRHGVALDLVVDERLGDVVGDERKVRQVLLNLLSNAVKFTPDGGRIGVRATRIDDTVEISVRDTGIGIAPEDQAAVFEEFRQVGGDRARKREGTGLGLALARRFVELHGGRIWVESEVGRGSTFTFTLAVTPHAEKLVLIVEDNERNRKLLRDVLQVQGYRTLDAETAEDGIRLAQQSRPGLVLMDIQLPGMDGVAALGALRADPRTRDIPVIAVTASVMPPDRGRIMAAGFDGYLAKPIDVKAFLEAVRETLGRRRGGGAAPAPSAADAGGMPAGTA